jgi:hypothetical protein
MINLREASLSYKRYVMKFNQFIDRIQPRVYAALIYLSDSLLDDPAYLALIFS